MLLDGKSGDKILVLAALSKYIWPALATLVPAAVTAAAKWAQDHSHKRRSAALTERISALAKSIAELPALPLSGASSAVTPQSALTAELEFALHELTVLQARVSHSFTGVSTITAKVRSALLLYHPKGFAAWTLHIAFFSYLFCFLFVLYAGMSPDPTSNVSNANPTDFVTSLFVFLTIFGLAGIPPLILRFYAAKIHRRQCAEAQAAAGRPVTAPLPAAGAAITPGQAI